MHKIRKFCMKFGYLILRIIIKFVATICQISRLNCTKFNFGHWGSLQCSPDRLPGFKRPTSKIREGKRWRIGRGEGAGRGGRKWKGKRERGGRDPQGLVGTPMFEILKNTLIKIKL